MSSFALDNYSLSLRKVPYHRLSITNSSQSYYRQFTSHNQLPQILQPIFINLDQFWDYLENMLLERNISKDRKPIWIEQAQLCFDLILGFGKKRKTQQVKIYMDKLDQINITAIDRRLKDLETMIESLMKDKKSKSQTGSQKAPNIVHYQSALLRQKQKQSKATLKKQKLVSKQVPNQPNQPFSLQPLKLTSLSSTHTITCNLLPSQISFSVLSHSTSTMYHGQLADAQILKFLFSPTNLKSSKEVFQEIRKNLQEERKDSLKVNQRENKIQILIFCKDGKQDDKVTAEVDIKPIKQQQDEEDHQISEHMISHSQILSHSQVSNSQVSHSHALSHSKKKSNKIANQTSGDQLSANNILKSTRGNLNKSLQKNGQKSINKSSQKSLQKGLNKSQQNKLNKSQQIRLDKSQQNKYQQSKHQLNKSNKQKGLQQKPKPRNKSNTKNSQCSSQISFRTKKSTQANPRVPYCQSSDINLSADLSLGLSEASLSLSKRNAKSHRGFLYNQQIQHFNIYKQTLQLKREGLAVALLCKGLTTRSKNKDFQFQVKTKKISDFFIVGFGSEEVGMENTYMSKFLIGYSPLNGCSYEYSIVKDLKVNKKLRQLNSNTVIRVKMNMKTQLANFYIKLNSESSQEFQYIKQVVIPHYMLSKTLYPLVFMKKAQDKVQIKVL